MRLSGEELSLFTAACADQGNIHAMELLNVFGAESAADVLHQVPRVNIGVFIDVVSHIWYAILHEASRRDPLWAEVLERMMS